LRVGGREAAAEGAEREAMKFSEAWLREWVDPPVGTEELVEQLTMAGLEVGSVTPVAGAFEQVVIGEVRQVEPHPDAQKLRVCRVSVGEGDALQIVCGAPNVFVGMRAPVALVGARLPGGMKIKKTKLRGVESLGMLCSEAELELAETADGLLSLPGDAPVGASVREYLKLDDRSIEIELTPDRGDCLSISGIAGEVGAIHGIPVKRPEIPSIAATIEESVEVHIGAPGACPRYACRVIRGIDRNAEAPQWMQEKLRRSGIRSLNAVVDVTNYVLLELGQPMHAFDLAKLSGPIEPRMARAEERIELLGGQWIDLREDSLVIADQTGPVALAGIMGGESTAVTAETDDILLESAFFAPAAIAGQPRSYGLQTDSSYRFERGVDPGLQVIAIERATQLLLEIVGGEPGPVIDSVARDHLPTPAPVSLRRTQIPRLLGVDLSDDEVRKILRGLGMTVEDSAEGWRVTPPTRRFDISIEVDLIEELGRIYGYSRIPVTHAPARETITSPREAAFDLNRAKALLAARGYDEAITYSFVDPDLLEMLSPKDRAIRLANPIASDMAMMRTTLWAGLLGAMRRNLSRQQERVRLFESGLRFRMQDTEIQQEPMIAGAVVGGHAPEQWGMAARRTDFFDVKGDVEAVLGMAGSGDEFAFVPAEHPALHPVQTARVVRGEEDAGWLGVLHPELEKRLDLPSGVVLFELRLDTLADGRLPKFSVLSKFPAIRRDLALVVDAGVGFDRIRSAVSAVEPEILQSLRVFDVYTGDKVDSGRKSIALGLILQANSRTLTDQEVDSVVARVLARLKTDCGAQLRE